MKFYLGDGVYVDFHPMRGLILTSENGVRVTNTIILEADVLRALRHFTATVPDTDFITAATDPLS